ACVVVTAVGAWVARGNPQLRKRMARWIGFDCGPCLTGICRSIDRSSHRMERVGALWIGCNFLEVPPALPKTLVAGKPSPACATVVRNKDATLFRIDRSIDAIVVRRRY